MAGVSRTFRLSEALEAGLLAVAQKQDRSVSWVIVKALEQALAGDESGAASRKVADPVPRWPEVRPVGSAASVRAPDADPEPPVVPPKIARRHWAS